MNIAIVKFVNFFDKGLTNFVEEQNDCKINLIAISKICYELIKNKIY